MRLCVGVLVLLIACGTISGCQDIEAAKREARAEGFRSGYRKAMAERLTESLGGTIVGGVVLAGIGLTGWSLLLTFQCAKPFFDVISERLAERREQKRLQREAVRVAKAKARDSRASIPLIRQRRETHLRHQIELYVRRHLGQAIDAVATYELNRSFNAAIRSDQQRVGAELRRRDCAYRLALRAIQQNRDLPPAQRLQLLTELDPSVFGSSHQQG